MAVDMTAEAKWGVTVEQVSALAPHISIGTNPAAPVDSVFIKADRSISVAEVEAWIADVAGRVTLRLADLGKIADDSRKGAIAQAAHDAVLNGAGSYLVAAAHPIGQTNANEGYAALLWARYESALDGAATALTGWIDELPKATVEAPGGAAAGFFPAPLFVDGGRF